MLTELSTLLEDHVSATVITVIVLIGTFCQVSKIPINPWSALGKLIKKIMLVIGDALNGDLRDQISDIARRMAKVEEERKEDRKKDVRRSILEFADECRIGARHSKEMFCNVLSDIDEYEKLCRDTGDPNSVTDEAVAYIKEINRKCQHDNDFL